MKLSDMRAQVAELRAKRDVLHDELHALLANEDLTVREEKAREAEIRAQVREINKVCWPMEVILGKTRKLTKGQELEGEELAMYQMAVAEVGEPVLG